MRTTLARICPDTLRPMSWAEVEQQMFRRAVIEAQMARAAAEAREAPARRVCWLFIAAMVVLILRSLI